MMSAEQKATWLNDRCGKLGASRMKHAMSYLKNGEPSAERVKLLHELLAERVTGLNARHVVTGPMQDGLDYEDEMFDFFVERTGRTIKLSRLYPHPSIENLIATPDREIDDGLMEGKVPTVEKFIAWKLAGITPTEHRPQMVTQCLCTGKRWVAFLAYCPWIKEESKRLFMTKYEPSAEEMAKVEAEAIKFLTELDCMFDAFVTA